MVDIIPKKWDNVGYVQKGKLSEEYMALFKDRDPQGTDKANKNVSD